MTIEVNKKEIIRLIKASRPDYNDINKFEKLGLGQYVGGHCDRWEWTHIEEDWAKFTIEALYALYITYLKK